MSWQNRKIFVTGADGFIGSHLVEALVDRGAVVTALAQYNSFDSFGWLDDLPPGTSSAIQRVRGDIRDVQQMVDLTRGQDIVFHLAALIGIPYSYEAPSSYVKTNVEGTVNLLTAARTAEVSRFVHTSTSEVYGTALFTPITEDHALQGQSPYSASKIAADMMVESFFRAFELPVVILRPFNTFGPRQSERAVISTIIRQALDANCESLRLGDISPARDFIFVDDTVSAFLHVAGLDTEHLGRTFNAGSGCMISIGELVEKVCSLIACEKPLIQENQRKRPANSEVEALMADSTRLTEASGWAPVIALEDGLGQTIEWWRGRLATVRSEMEYAI